MVKTVLLAGIMSLASLVTMAQSGTIRGVVSDKTTQTPVAGATVSLLLSTDSSSLKTVLTDNTGRFEFPGIQQGSFLLTITNIGYQQYVSSVVLRTDEKDLGTLSLDKQGKELSVVTVIAKAAPVIQKADTVQYSASQYKVNPDATTEDLIKKMPGITVAKDGTVTAHGEQVKKVTIDGKDFFGDDATAALRNLPSEVVDKIQVFDKLSDQAQLTGFDDGNSQKAINVVTKTGIKNGQFGRAYAGYGTDDRYSAGGNVSFFKGNRRISLVGNFNNINQQNFGAQDLLGVSSSGGGRGGGRGGGGRGNGGGGSDNFTVGQASGISKTNAFGLNYIDQWGKKVFITGSYFFNNSTNTNNSFIDDETFGTNGRNLFSLQNSNSGASNNNHRINLRMEYRIDSSNSIFIIPSINLQNNNSSSANTLNNFYGLNDTLSKADINSSAKRNGYNIRNTLLYRHNFAKKGRTISLGFNTTFTRNYGESVTDGDYRFWGNSGPLPDSLQNQYTDSRTNGNTIGGNLTYTEPVGKKGQLQFSYAPSVQVNKADQQTFMFDGVKYSIFDTALSNKFDNTITTHNGGITYRLSPSKDEQLFFGINYQNSTLESDRKFPSVSAVDQRFSNILGNAMWRKKISAKSNIRLMYRSSTNYPSISQLQDVIDLSNPQSVSTGNPYLKQAYSHLLSGRYTFSNSKTGRSFFANLFLQTTNNYISNATYITFADSLIQKGIVLKKGSQLTKPVNLNGYNSLRTFFTYSFPVKSLKTTINLNTGFSYSKLPGLVNYQPVTTNNYVYNGGVVFASNISEFVDFNISYNASFNNAATSGGSVATNNYVNQSFGTVLNLLSKKGWFIQNDVSNQSYSGLTAGSDQSYWLWNAAIGRKFLKNKAGELKLSVFDLLKQNQSIVRTVTERDIQDVQSNVLQQYFMLTFTYNLKNFGKGKPAASRRDNFDGRPNMPPPPGGNGPGF